MLWCVAVRGSGRHSLGSLEAYLGFGIHDGDDSIVVVPAPATFPPIRLECEEELAVMLACRTGEVPPASPVPPTQIGEGKEGKTGGHRGRLEAYRKQMERE